MAVKRIFVEKKKGYSIEAQGLKEDLTINLGIENLTTLRILNRYDLEGMSEEEFRLALPIVFSEPPVDHIYEDAFPSKSTERIFAVEYLPGQFDQRADSAAQCVQLLTHGERPMIKVAKMIVLEGALTESEYVKVKAYCINPVESREASLALPKSLDTKYPVPEDIKSLDNFIGMKPSELENLAHRMGFAMNMEDLLFCQVYFKDEEHRDPTVTEIRLIDTYWSDHCRHTTFLTELIQVKIADSPYSLPITEAYNQYLQARKEVYKDKSKKETLMDMATLGMKALKNQGLLEDLDESEEINACSIVVPAEIDGQIEDWLVMFKNETHNHPTEIEPFGGAATCLGGAIRDPLSGRSYVYQAMRVTGSGDPRTPIEDTILGKLPQRKITTGAAAGYSAYGNQIGLATGQVVEVYHPGYAAKRMEIGAVIGAVPKADVVRSQPEPGDIVVLLGGQTGRDGCGGATGSSKAHTEESLTTCGAEVQKGNPPTERKIQRLFRRPQVSRCIKRCNDFGAGGVSVAIGELADGLRIDLDAIPKKYEGLDGTELAISESQERMAVVLSPADVSAFIQAAKEENLEASVVAEVTKEPRLCMLWRKKKIVDIARSFLDTNGAGQDAVVYAAAPNSVSTYFDKRRKVFEGMDVKEAWLNNLADLNVCSQRGLVERFDSTIGAATVLMPLGGKNQMTPAEGMAAKLPVKKGETHTATLMSYGLNPYLSEWSPFHGAVYAIVEAAAKITAMGGDYRQIRLTLQEYFERLLKDPVKWGKPFSALLGAFYTQMGLKIPAIGGKDSMSGTFLDLSVPPTLTAFAVCIADARQLLSPEFKKPGSQVVLLNLPIGEDLLPDFAQLDKNYTRVHQLIQSSRVLSVMSVREGGVAEAVTKMAIGNSIGIKFNPKVVVPLLFAPSYGSLVLELMPEENISELLSGLSYTFLGTTQEEPNIILSQTSLSLKEAASIWEEPLERIFPALRADSPDKAATYQYANRNHSRPGIRYAAPEVFIPVFPGTNCEYDSARAFERAGARTNTLIVQNLTPGQIEDTILKMAEGIAKAQIIMIPGGFSGGDEPEGSGKFIAAAFRNPRIKEEILNLLYKRDGLILGVCNGFQALIKLGLLPYGEIRDIGPDDPTLTFNTIGRHMSRMVTTRVASVLSPWLSKVEVDALHTIPVSHGEGRFIANPTVLASLAKSGQIATQYVDEAGLAAATIPHNPNGSVDAIEGITSPDGRVFGKMGHSERIGLHVGINIPGEKDQKIFESGVAYFR